MKKWRWNTKKPTWDIKCRQWRNQDFSGGDLSMFKDFYSWRCGEISFWSPNIAPVLIRVDEEENPIK